MRSGSSSIILKQRFIVVGQAKKITLLGDIIERTFVDQAIRNFRTIRECSIRLRTCTPHTERQNQPS